MASAERAAFDELRAEDLSMAAVAEGLNQMHVRTARGAAWTPMAVKRVLDRAG